MSRSDEPPLDHLKAQRLLPWLLTGTLEGAELVLLQRHLDTCAACRADLARERRLRAIGQAEPRLDPEAALARLAPRLPARLPPCLPPQPAPRTGHVRNLLRWACGLAANDSPWLRTLAAAQFALNAALLALLLAQSLAKPAGDGARYRLMGTAEPVRGDLIVGFRPDTPERELRRIFEASGTRVLDGPTVTGAYVLAARGAPPARALARLRAEPAVTLAQPLGAEGRP